MSSVNKVIIVGRLGADPEVRTFQSGDKVANLRVATSESWKDKQTGERQERTEWHTVAIFGGMAEVAERYLKKGSQVYLEGQLQTRKWQDQSGADRYSTEVVLRPFAGSLTLLGGAPGGGQDGRQNGGGASGGGTGKPGGGWDGGWNQGSGSSGGKPPFNDDLDDDVPF